MSNVFINQINLINQNNSNNIENITRLQKQNFSLQQTEVLSARIPNNLIINVCGMAGVGKGTLCEGLAKRLKIPYVYTGKIWRAITYIYTYYNCSINRENSQKILNLLTCKLEDNEVQFYYYDLYKLKDYQDRSLQTISLQEIKNCTQEKKLAWIKLEHYNLKNAIIDSKVPFYASDLDLHQQFFDKAVEVYQNIQKAFVRDGRGANPLDLIKIEQKNYRIIRLLIDCTDEVKWQRYKQAVFYNRRANNLNIEENIDFEEKLWLEFKKNILERNQKDQETQAKLGNDFLSEDTVILDNSYLTIEETIQTALAYIDSQIL